MKRKILMLIIIASLSIKCSSSYKLKRYSKEVYLNWADKGLTSLKKTKILKYFNLKKINLSRNKFNSFPKELFKLQKLERIFLINNRIDSIPDDIENLKNLITLDLSGNHITYITPKISNIKSLKFVLLRGKYTHEERKILSKTFPNTVRIKYFIEESSTKGTKNKKN